MHDLAIRGGTIVDGTGAPKFTGDVAVENGRIVSVGGKAGPARRSIEADGRIVAPGWVDIHTHYDGQATWDPLLAPSSWHGVTTALMGNCGVGFAPVRRHDHENLIELMEGVEDIPHAALAEGLKWDWETFPEYLDALARLPRVIDVAAQIPHNPLRVYVMGERAIRYEAATAEDKEEMRRLTEQALRAGAFGFTATRTDQHKTSTGALVPGRHAELSEYFAIGSALKAAGFGVFGLNNDFIDVPGDLAWLARLAREMSRPLWFTLSDRTRDPQLWRRLLAGVQAAREAGAPLVGQIAGRPVGLLLGVATSLNPFSIRPAYQALNELSPADRLRRLKDPELRRAVLAERPTDAAIAALPGPMQAVATRWNMMFELGNPPDYEPGPERSIAAAAQREGRSPEEAAYDYLFGGDLTRMLFIPVANYSEGDQNNVRQLLTAPGTVLGLSDGGAHCGLISDASVPSYLLTHWARDRRRGERLPIEWVVKRQTSETAKFYGFNDRGVLAAGLKADVNVIDLERLQIHVPEMVRDLPAGGRRLVQRVEGYAATIVSGVPIFENGEETGAKPGRLVRSQEVGGMPR